MPGHICCLNYVPRSLEPWNWADAVLHPGLTIQELWTIVGRLDFLSPYTIFVPPDERLPYAWILLESLWRYTFACFDKAYTVRDDPRCRVPVENITIETEVSCPLL